jgi:hypothetical protein
MGRRAWRQWRAIARFVLSQFFGNLPQEAGREDVDVEQLPRWNLDLVGRLVPGPVEDNLRGVEDGRGVQHGRERRRLLRRREEPCERIDRGVPAPGAARPLSSALAGPRRRDNSRCRAASIATHRLDVPDAETRQLRSAHGEGPNSDRLFRKE